MSLPFSLQFSLLGVINGLTCSFPEQHYSRLYWLNLPALDGVKEEESLFFFLFSLRKARVLKEGK